METPEQKQDLQDNKAEPSDSNVEGTLQEKPFEFTTPIEGLRSEQKPTGSGYLDNAFYLTPAIDRGRS